ncbi:hypothetical protein [Microcoleus sp.]|uniref:hypothetical protein n=1 Tax=Microcoleus sp. TaxID=44472 RepID=UPI003523ACA6
MNTSINGSLVNKKRYSNRQAALVIEPFDYAQDKLRRNVHFDPSTTLRATLRSVTESVLTTLVTAISTTGVPNLGIFRVTGKFSLQKSPLKP